MGYAMISYNSNGSEVFGVFTAAGGLLPPEIMDKMLRTIASTLTAAIHDRVHVNGLDSNEQPIGTYTPEYMKVRTNTFKSSKIVRGINKGQARKKYNRTADTKVILSLTRQMEIDMSVCEQNPIKTDYGYAIGYQNDFNFVKMQENEKRYGKPILTKLSKKEEQIIDSIVEKTLNNVSNRGN